MVVAGAWVVVVALMVVEGWADVDVDTAAAAADLFVGLVELLLEQPPSMRANSDRETRSIRRFIARPPPLSNPRHEHTQRSASMLRGLKVDL